MFTQFEKIVKDIEAAGGMANYQKNAKENRLKNAYSFEVSDFNLEFPHKLPYLTITTTTGSEVKFGEVGAIEEIRNEDNSIAVSVRNRPYDLSQATVPTLHRFKFKSSEDMVSFINKVMIFKRMY